MGAQAVVATTPAQLVKVPRGYSLYQRINVTNVGGTLVSFLSGGVLPSIPVPNVSGPAGRTYAFRFVDLSSETDPLSVKVRYTDDGQTSATATLGFVVPQEPSWVRIPCDPNDIYLISAGADVKVQVRLGIFGQEGP